MPLRSPAPRPFLLVCAIAALLFGGTTLLYLRALPYDFSNYDDPRYITNNPYVQQGFTWTSLKWAFIGNADYWHPLTWISHILDWQLYGDVAAGHHLTSILWHAVNAVLALLVFRRLTGSTWVSAFAAALFAWHPLRVESVVWITERKDVMSGTFFLLTLWSYLEYAGGRSRRGAWYLLTLGLFAAGLMCKPSLVTLPLVLLALDFWPLHRFDGGAQSGRETSTVGLLLEKVPFFALSAATAVATVQMQRAVGAFTLQLPVTARLANVPVAIVRYLGKFLWPDALTVCYPHPGWWPTWAVCGSTLLVGALSVLAWQQRKQKPWILIGWVWFVVMLLPTLGIVQVGFQSMADRYTYLPMLGIELALVWTLVPITTGRRGQLICATAAVAAVVPLAARTWNQEATWRDPVTLFRHAIAVTDRNQMAEAFLGYTLAAQGRTEEAASHCERAIAMNPRNEMAVSALAGIRGIQGRLDEAIAGFRTSLELTKDEPTTEYALALLLLRRGDVGEATTLLRKAAATRASIIRDNLRIAAANARSGQIASAVLSYTAATLLEPENADAQLGLGRSLVQVGRDREALACFQRALDLQPRMAEARVELGFVFLRSGQPLEAMEQFKSARSTDPTLVTAGVGFGRAAEQLGEKEYADEAFRNALAQAPNDPDVARAWAEILARRRRFTEAITFYRRAIELRPSDAPSHAGLGFILLLTGHREDAIAEWKVALRFNPRFPGLRERIEQMEK